MPDFTINHGRQILRELWWKKHERLSAILSWGVVAIIIVMFWSAALDRLVQDQVR